MNLNKGERQTSLILSKIMKRAFVRLNECDLNPLSLAIPNYSTYITLHYSKFCLLYFLNNHITFFFCSPIFSKKTLDYTMMIQLCDSHLQLLLQTAARTTLLTNKKYKKLKK